MNENPPAIWPQVDSIQDFQGQWWVAHTKSRNEKALAHDLIARNVSYFLPMTLKVNRRSHRTLKSLLPLFTGMFLETNPIPVKTAMSLQGKLKEIFRSPLCSMAPANKEKLKSILKSLNLL